MARRRVATVHMFFCLDRLLAHPTCRREHSLADSAESLNYLLGEHPLVDNAFKLPQSAPWHKSKHPRASHRHPQSLSYIQKQRRQHNLLQDACQAPSTTISRKCPSKLLRKTPSQSLALSRNIAAAKRAFTTSLPSHDLHDLLELRFTQRLAKICTWTPIARDA